MATMINSKFVKTRKEHNCFGCCEKINIGEHVRVDTCIDMGQIFNCYLCDICDNISNEFDYGDEFSEGELRDTEAYEYYRNKQHTTAEAQNS